MATMNGKIVLITGGSGGLGRTVVPAFLASGARTITVDRTPLTRQGDHHWPMQVDLTDEAGLQRIVTEVMTQHQRIDVCVNLVGAFATGRAVETEAAQWQRMLTVNVTAAFLLSKAVLRPMLEQRSGRLMHMVARAAVDPFAGAAAYVVSKAGLAALVRTLALETAGTGVTVNGILPGTIDTPANRKNMPDADPSTWVQPESIARLLIFLASAEAGQINGALIPLG